MTLQIGLILLLILLALIAVIREWAAPDVIALSVLGLGMAMKETPYRRVTGAAHFGSPGNLPGRFPPVDPAHLTV